MSYSFFALLDRMKLINRWCLMRNMRTENLCEHSLSVAFITHALAVMHNQMGGKVDVPNAVMFALYHDCSEIITGDMPTPIKYRNEDIKTAYKKIESEAGGALVEMLEEDLQKEFAPYFEEPTGVVKELVKSADTLSALIKCIEEKNMGNHDFDRAYESTLEKLKKNPMPEVKRFMDTYLPAFGQTLDDLEQHL